MYPVYPFVSDIHICHLFQSICTKTRKQSAKKKQLRGLIKSYQDVLNQPLPKNMVRLRSEVPNGSHQSQGLTVAARCLKAKNFLSCAVSTCSR
jgi:hypothetical protein